MALKQTQTQAACSFWHVTELQCGVQAWVRLLAKPPMSVPAALPAALAAAVETADAGRMRVAYQIAEKQKRGARVHELRDEIVNQVVEQQGGSEASNGTGTDALVELRAEV